VPVLYCGRVVSLLVEVTKNKPVGLTMCGCLYILQGSLRFHRAGDVGAQVLETMLGRVAWIRSVKRTGLLQVNSLAQFSPDCQSWAGLLQSNPSASAERRV